MRAISIRQPYASQVTSGKSVENRSLGFRIPKSFAWGSFIALHVSSSKVNRRACSAAELALCGHVIGLGCFFGGLMTFICSQQAWFVCCLDFKMTRMRRWWSTRNIPTHPLRLNNTSYSVNSRGWRIQFACEDVWGYLKLKILTWQQNLRRSFQVFHQHGPSRVHLCVVCLSHMTVSCVWKNSGFVRINRRCRKTLSVNCATSCFQRNPTCANTREWSTKEAAIDSFATSVAAVLDLSSIVIDTPWGNTVWGNELLCYVELSVLNWLDLTA